MGRNIALNIAESGFDVSVYNRTYSKTEWLIQDSSFDNLVGFETLEDFVSSLEKPRRIMLMVKAGRGTDAVIDQLIPLLEKGDIIIDGWNAHWENTIKRSEKLQKEGIHFIGSGVSGGEEWARHGPSLMPWWDPEAYETIRPIWEAIAAKDFSWDPCTTHVGKGPAGNFVKMVHNGIEYAIMQAIAEVYDLYRYAGYDNNQIHEVFSVLNTWLLESFLLEITTEIFTHEDPKNPGSDLIDKIRDRAKSKGTWWWTVQSAIDLGVPVPSISEALMARQISAREWRFHIDWQQADEHEQKLEFDIDWMRDTLTLAYLWAYLQWLDCIKAADEEYEWWIDLGEVIRIWQWGCIIRSRMLEILPAFFDNSITRPTAYQELQDAIPRLLNNTSGILDKPRIPSPVLGSIRDYFMAIYRKKLPTNLIQAQRDYFWAHTFERIDSPDGDLFHHDWDA